ncbi:periplasmic binding protein-like II [Neocallimastix californiae]|uniref:Periplasmic binding protein-like II n=1 Tax=Neocallimastix californiae TaxID=1754190 RepID=A0A1Y2DGA3_9FUNG|nr:periplasmic binding protein-like II [Neocallimastix californiae]|eukprot:ORY58323.1 periplasmic binding protein-like II [Neocallimastix californiae]
MKTLLINILFFTVFFMVKGIEIRMHGFLYSYNDYHKLLAERTNEYMKSKGLDITLVTNFETPDTSRGEPNYVANYVEDLLQKEERGYDLYLTDTVYTGRFSKYFEDISKYVDPKVIELYKEGTATNTCIVDTRLVGLPLMVDYAGLYANKSLLEKYKRSIPETWDELIETTNYIYERESKVNPKLHKYLGHFPEYENGLVVILEFIHSFRDLSTDKFPKYTSDNAVAALEKMKQIKEKASTPDDFAANEITMGDAFTNGNFIFLRFWYIADEMKTQFNNVTVSFNQLPGKKKGISASCVGGSNISMNKYISEERKKAAGEVMSFINSYENQKFGIIKYDLRSAIHSTYSDPEICEKINCLKFSSMQSIVRPSSSSINYDEYSENFRNLARKYIYGDTDQSALEILTEVDDMRKIHFLEINSLASITTISLIFIIIALLALSLIYITIHRFKQQFVFLPYGYWCTVIIGIFLMSIYGLTGIRELNNYKCLIRPFLLSIGFNLIYIPVLLKMIAIFPKKNGLTKFVKDHFSLLFIFFLIIDVGINISWYLLDPLIVNKLTVTSVIENININNRYLYFGFRAGLVLIFCFSTLIIIIGSKYYQISIKMENPYPDITSFNKSSSSGLNSSNYYHSNYNSSIINSKFNPGKNTILSYHYVTGTSLPPSTATKSYPALFTSTMNSNYNENLFTNNSSSNNTQSQSSEDFKYNNISKNFLYSTNSSNNFNNNSMSYSNSNYSNNNYSKNSKNYYSDYKY